MHVTLILFDLDLTHHVKGMVFSFRWYSVSTVCLIWIQQRCYTQGCQCTRV